jgi:IS5 family transposase
MNSQMSFSQSEFASKKRVTRREAFLREMEAVVPWKELIARIEPHYPRGQRGRPPIGIERMLRLLVVQNCYGLSDEALEDAVYDSQSVRHFVGVDLNVEAAPDATTILKFRRLLEAHDLGAAIFATISMHLERHGLLMRQGTIVDATIIEAPSSTKNKEGARDPEMHAAKKGNQWHFGMKAHIGVDTHSGLVHSVTTTAANQADITQTAKLLHGQERLGFADAGYVGVDKRPELEAANKRVKWLVAQKRGKLKAMAEGALKEAVAAAERAKAQVRALVEHPFHVVKNLFKHRKARYRGLRKNTVQVEILFGLAHLVIAKRGLMLVKAL